MEIKQVNKKAMGKGGLAAALLFPGFPVFG
jgi:hypothetical protein